jgi:hypothetical protein
MMEKLLSNLKRELVLRNINDCIEKSQIDACLRYLLFQLSGPVSYSYVSYHGDQASTVSEIVAKTLERAPMPHGSRIPPIDYGVIFDTKTVRIIAYMFNPLQAVVLS